MGGVGSLQLSPELPLPLERAGVRAISVATQGRNLVWNLCCFRSRLVGHSRCPPGSLRAPGSTGAACGAWAFLKFSGAARRRCDWPRLSNLYANEAAPPLRRRGPGELAGKEGAFAPGLGGRT